jgi:diaminohydroxyphosphoribosylaminopyrimidine deaminase/5-amino-6-(5-phosphoribosylamino)uracil reductase|tara:strand:- start:116292 stop:117428 length:1137 start_codon:yes stop_codon:yes gene_type:complete
MTFTAIDHTYMQRALALAKRGLYTTAPNPRVGCVLVANGEVVGEGFHVKAGEPHAERNALLAAGDNARGATCYVTLEPCSHTGRTGPCADALIDAGVHRVIAAMEDPHSKVAGQGFAKLRAAGIQVDVGLLESEARALNSGFIRRMETGRPYVRIKLAMSLDGRTAMASGESKWITGDAAREDVQHWRACSSAIISGIGTVLADDPSLTVRPQSWRALTYPDVAVRQPVRVILDRSLKIPMTAKLLGEAGQTLLVSGQDDSGTDAAHAGALTQKGGELIYLPSSGSGIDLAALLDELGRRECNDVLVEAGPTLAAAFVREGLFDELLIYMAPTLLGSSARALLAMPELEKMSEQIKLTLFDCVQIGDDLRLRYQPVRC